MTAPHGILWSPLWIRFASYGPLAVILADSLMASPEHRAHMGYEARYVTGLFPVYQSRVEECPECGMPGALLLTLLGPAEWFGSTDRIEMAESTFERLEAGMREAV